MALVLTAVVVLLVTGALALVLPATSRLPKALGVGGCVAAAALGLVPAIAMLAGGAPESLRWAWTVPFGEFHVGLDGLSAWFLVPVFGLSALTAVYGGGYLEAFEGRRRLGPVWFFFNVLVASIVLVLTARNGVLFLVCWEAMSLASFFLVTFEDDREHVRQAGWIYLVATHLGTAFLLVLFVLLGRESGSLDFESWDRVSQAAPGVTGLLFVLAVVGFGTKAGFMPFHVWLPEAHPAAPSHVSALMSGVMIKTGIYGLLRVVQVLGQPAAWWGWLLLAFGLASGVLGAVSALAQHDLKRSLAYSSVENVGLIAVGLGLGLIGLSAGVPAMAVLGFAGALLHVLNHAVCKGLLFLGAGNVMHATGTRQMDQLGGLLKRMPWTGTSFLTGAAALSGLPPFNGFVSEWLLFLSAWMGIVSGVNAAAAPALVTVAGLALVSGLAAACFTRAAGITFLGEPRTRPAGRAHEAGAAMRWPVAALAFGCVALGLAAPSLVGEVGDLAARLTHLPLTDQLGTVSAAEFSASCIVFVAATLWGFVGLLVILRRRLLAGRVVGEAGTWDCGYARPTARMQYTASSFAQPLTHLFAGLLGTRRQLAPPQGLFPREASLKTEPADLCQGELYQPAFERLTWGLSRLRWLQHGKVQLYVLYITVTLLALLLWKLR